MKPLLTIVGWPQYFETYESGRLKTALNWVALPTKHDGRSYRRLIREKDGPAIYGAWVTMVQVAAKMPVRGVLADRSGPLDAEDLWDKTMIPQKLVERMLKVVTSDRIGWAKWVTDQEEIAGLLREVCVDTRKKGERPAGHAGAPADHAGNSRNLRGNGETPAECGDLAESAGAPADARTPCGDSRPSRVRAGGQDITRQDRTEHSPAGSALDSTSEFILQLFGKKRRRLSSAAEHELARHAADLPLSLDQQNLLRWFYGIAPDAEDFDLKTRHQDADRLASNLFAAIERAAAYAKKSGIDIDPKRAAAPVQASEPAGCWEWFAEAYPAAPRVGSWQSLPESVRSEFELARRRG